MRSPSKTVLIAAISGRALAQAARRAGYRPLVADFFEDLDTVGACARTARLPGDLRKGVDASATLGTLQKLADGEAIDCLVLGSGFERLPHLVDDLARRFPLAGNTGGTIRRIKDPVRLAADCKALDIPHPALRHDPPSDPAKWVMKIAGAAGGTHVRRADSPAKVKGAYYQQRLDGAPVSALFIGTEQGARIVGFSRQWQSPAPGAPYRYGGAVRLSRFPRRDAAMIEDWLAALTARTGLRGLCSADFMRSGRGYHLLEINPRPGATLDIFDNDATLLFEAHVRACRGKPFKLRRGAGSVASMVAYAQQELASLPAFQWPDWTADHQKAGSALAAGDPICTVFGSGSNAAAARRNLNRNARMLEQNWAGCRP